jgi:hypothetical protein
MGCNMKKLLVALLATGIQIASADCLETIKKIQDGLGTPAGSPKQGIIDFMRSENDLFERGLNISQDLVQRAAGRPIASSSLGIINVRVMKGLDRVTKEHDQDCR